MLRVLNQIGARSGRRFLHIATRPVQAAAPTTTEKKDDVDPTDPIIAPTTIPWQQYKNEYYLKRGYKLADKEWTEWSDLPAPYKYLGVKVNPKDVENHGVFWKTMSDWKLAMPMTMLVAMPLWMTGNFIGFDERLELALITMVAGTAIFKNLGPLFRQWKTSSAKPVVDGLYAAEKSLNDEIARAIETFKAGSALPDTIRTVNSAERALRKLEADAATIKQRAALRDSMASQLDYLVALRSSAAGETDSVVMKAARSILESKLEKDAALQQKTIETALKALKEGAVVPTDDVVAPAFLEAVQQATKEVKAKPSTNPFTQAQQIEMFQKRYGYGADNTRSVSGLKVKSPLSYLK